MNENEYGVYDRMVTDRKPEVLDDIVTEKLKYSKVS
jgi:hypothetical protein